MVSLLIKTLVSVYSKVWDTGSAMQRFVSLLSCGLSADSLKLWPQLSLSTSLDIPKLKVEDRQPDILIAIKRGIEPQMSQAVPRVLLSENVDIRPPESVLCAEFERLQIQFRFFSIQGKQPPVAKRVKSGSAELEIVDEMLFDLSSDHRGSHLEELEDVVGGLKGLSDTIKRGFGPPKPVNEMLLGLSSNLHKGRLEGLEDIVGVVNRPPDAIPNYPYTTITGKCRRYPKETIEILKGWLEANAKNPYPSEDQKGEMMRRTGLSRGISMSSAKCFPL
jgi:hypothetical protein